MQERKPTALQHNEDSDSDTEMGENEPQGKCSFSSFWLVILTQNLLS